MLRALALVFALGSGMVLAAGSSAGAVENTPILVVTGAESYEAGSDACFTVSVDGAALSGDALVEVDQAESQVALQFVAIADGTGTACFSSLASGDYQAWAMWLSDNPSVAPSAQITFAVVSGDSGQVEGTLSIAPTASEFVAGDPICFDTSGADAAVGQGASLSVRKKEGTDTDATAHTDAVAPAFNPQTLCVEAILAPGDYVASFTLDDQTIIAEPAFFSVTAPASSTVLAPPQVALVPSSVAWIVGAAEHLAVTVSGVGETPTGSVTLSAVDGDNNDVTPVGDTQLNAGAAVFDLSAVPAGTSTLVVTYSGDAGNAPTRASVSVTVSAAASSSEVVRIVPTIALTPQEAQVSTYVPVTISVAGPAESGAVPTGDVTIHYGEGDADQTTLTLSAAGTATVEMLFNLVGSTTLRVDYPGDASFAPTDQSFQVLVKAPPVSEASSASPSAEASSAPSSAPLLPSQLTASADADEVEVGGLVDLIGQLHVDGGTPTGTITFFEGDTAIASPSAMTAISGGLFEGRAQVNFDKVGVHTLRAVYSGDATWAPSEAMVQVTVVEPVTPASSKAELPVLMVSGAQSFAAGAAACFTVTASTGAPSGEAMLEVSSGQDQATATVFSLQDGTGIACVSGLAVGDYTAVAMSTNEQLAAQTSGPFNFSVEAASNASSASAPSSSPPASTPLLTPDFAALAAADAVGRDTPVELIGQIHFTGEAPTGHVTFLEDNTAIALGGLTGLSSASLAEWRASASFATTGEHRIVAIYSGDANYVSAQYEFVLMVVVPEPAASSASSSAPREVSSSVVPPVREESSSVAPLPSSGEEVSSSEAPPVPSSSDVESGLPSEASSRLIPPESSSVPALPSSEGVGDDGASSSPMEEGSSSSFPIESSSEDDEDPSGIAASSEVVSSSVAAEGVAVSSSSSSSAASSQPAGGPPEDGSSSSNSVASPAGPSSASSSASSTPPPVQTVTMKIQLSHITDPNGSIENSMTAFFSPSSSGDSFSGVPTLGYAAISPERAQISTSLSAINAAAGNQKRSPLDLWLDGTFGLLQQGATHGSYFSGHAGVSYLFTPDLLAGTAVSFTQVATVDGAGHSSSLGVMLTPYVGGKLSDSLFVNGYAGYGLSQIAISPDGTYTDAVLGRRWLVGGSLSGQFRLDNWLFAPMLSAQYGEFATDAYVDGHGGAIAASLAGEGVLSFAPRLSVDFRLADGTVVTPNATLGAGIGITNDNGTWTSTGLSDSAALGLVIARPGGATFDARLGVTGLIAGNLKSVNARVGLKASLH